MEAAIDAAPMVRPALPNPTGPVWPETASTKATLPATDGTSVQPAAPRATGPPAVVPAAPAAAADAGGKGGVNQLSLARVSLRRNVCVRCGTVLPTMPPFVRRYNLLPAANCLGVTALTCTRLANNVGAGAKASINAG